MLFLTGDSPRTQDGRGAFQEIDQVVMTSPLVKHSHRFASAGALAADVAGAILIAKRQDLAIETGVPEAITPPVLCAAVQQYIDAAAESVVISDGGEFVHWALAATSGTRRIINGPSGAIRGALCYAIAAAKAKPDATVVAFMGDGTVGFHFAEFETAVRANTPIVVVVGNDGC